MAFITVCPACLSKMVVKDRLDGHSVTCPKCVDCCFIARPRHTVRKKSRAAVAVCDSAPAPAAAAELSNWESTPRHSEIQYPVHPLVQAGEAMSWCHFALAFGGVALLGAFFIPWVSVVVVLAVIGLLSGGLSLFLGESNRRLTIMSVTGLVASAMAMLTTSGGDARAVESTKATPKTELIAFDRNRSWQQTPQSDQWIDAAKFAVTVNDLCVGVKSVSYERIQLERASQPNAGRPVMNLLIHLRVVPIGRVPKDFPFAAWSDAAPKATDRVQLTDATGTSVPLLRLASGTCVTNHTRHLKFDPKMYIEDVLVFEWPTIRMEQLRLTVPASAIGGSGAIRFLIPGEMVRK